MVGRPLVVVMLRPALGEIAVECVHSRGVPLRLGMLRRRRMMRFSVRWLVPVRPVLVATTDGPGGGMGGVDESKKKYVFLADF